MRTRATKTKNNSQTGRERGFVVVVDGPDGAGKSTQCERIAQALQDRRPLVVRDPGSTLVAERVRDVLLDATVENMSAECEMLLYMACRAELVEHRIAPALNAGRVVVCDRFTSSTYAYQGFGLGLEGGVILSLGEFVCRGYEPDLWIILDIDPERSLLRKGDQTDRVQGRDLAFHNRVREGFLDFADRFCDVSAVVDADRPAEDVFEDIMEAVNDALR